MLNSVSVAHGGALAAAVKKYGGNKADWLDLSTGINPVSAPIPNISSNVWQALPDADMMESCLNSARKFYGIQAQASIVAAPGVQALIQLLPCLRPGKKAAILGPTYGEYAHVFQTLGAGCRIISSIDQIDDESIIIAVNPNNPDGRVFAPGALIDVAETLAQNSGLLIVDEAFCDLTPQISVASHAAMPGLLVLRSFGKFFGLAGVRLGFAIGHPDDIAILTQNLGPWAVSGPALTIGAGCLNDRQLRAQTIEFVLVNSAKQLAMLQQFGLNAVANTGLFHLVEHPNATPLHEVLANHNILTRIFVDQPNWLRLGLCKNDDERARLVAALSSGLSTV